jgi:hypothetical protein
MYSQLEVAETCLKMRHLHMFDAAFAAWNCQCLALCVSSATPRPTIMMACVYARDVVFYHLRIANACR